ncbi:MAG: hypothetical protein EAX95_15985 [Candidatus Thorarchaeota archaeon]|nr:hypothetical protein [Candidatus Thorarchaeota archaeon]
MESRSSGVGDVGYDTPSGLLSHNWTGQIPQLSQSTQPNALVSRTWQRTQASIARISKRTRSADSPGKTRSYGNKGRQVGFSYEEQAEINQITAFQKSMQ